MNVAMKVVCGVASVFAAALSSAPASARPTLATPAQLAAEQRTLRIIANPVVKAAAARERQVLLADPAARVADGRALLDRALDLWVNSLTFAVANGDPWRPRLLFGIEDTPRAWLGHTLPGGGMAGDNPDNIYVGGYIDGSLSYTLTGRIPSNGPGNLTVEIFRARPGRLDMVPVAAGTGSGPPRADLGNQVRMFQREELHADASGRFTITLGPDSGADPATHVVTPPAPLSITIRNTLTDWRQAPIAVSLRRTDSKPSPAPLTDDQMAARVAEYLPAYVAAWSRFKEHFLGAPPANRLAGPLPRDGGWGWLAGGAYALEPDEALVVTTANSGARYSGFQLLDRWFLSRDSRKAFTSLNIGQAIHNPDGTTTYIIALRDPGYANWLDASESPHGFANLRWQGMAPGTDGKRLLRGVQLVKLADLGSIVPATLPRVSPAERATALRARAADYESRLFAVAR